ncbi:Tas protein, an NADP(H)-dependent aldo-keto reductase [hydrothermal vent metagenome]|uniref:Tas protein, an NADP(H)-dependent aldo-keto reductase n=1 Tax=hydrothermal vent metagenome TaxID=652676 RepID=A0A3B0TE46_9ZZZZ
MKFRTLGRSGVAVSELCLGTMTWGSQNSEAEAFEQMDHATDQGINFFDTAEMYPTTPSTPENQGLAETIIGNWLKARGRRDEIVIGTKIVGKGFARIRDGAKISAKTLDLAVEGSLRRLGTDTIDLYQLHWPNRGSYAFRQHWAYDPSRHDRSEARADHEEIFAAMTRLVDAGKVRLFGLSNDSAWGLGQYLRLAEIHGGPRVVTIQNEYSLMTRLFSLDLAEMCHHEDVGLMPYSPLAAGLLTGKYSGGAVPPGSRKSIKSDLGGRYTTRSAAVADLYVAAARKHGLDPAQMALAFTLCCKQVASTIIGATNMDQLKTNIGASDVTLGDEVLAEIAAITRANPMPY